MIILFSNREEAGRRLAEQLKEYKGKNAIVLAVPRGGVVVAYQVAKELFAPLDLIIPRKLGAPGNPELAMGAVTQDGTIVLNEDIVEQLGIPKSCIKEEAAGQIKEIERRMKAYRGDRPFPDLANKIVIVVDDGIATGATIRAAIQSIKKRKPAFIVIAVPVAPPETVRSLEKESDRVVVLETPEWFMAIGQFYENFEQTSDEEVLELLTRSYQA